MVYTGIGIAITVKEKGKEKHRCKSDGSKKIRNRKAKKSIKYIHDAVRAKFPPPNQRNGLSLLANSSKITNNNNQ